MIRKKVAGAAVALMLMLGTSATAQAAVVFKTLQLTASGFNGTAAAIDPISVLFTLNFDNSADINNSTTGITQLSNNAYGPLNFGYSAANDFLVLVGGNGSAGGGGCSNTTSSFCTFIANISSASPTSDFTIQVASDDSVSFARSVTIENVAAVPEPAVWAMMLLGFALTGAALRRRKPIVRTTVSYA